MNFMLEWQEQYASNDLFVVVIKTKNRLNQTLRCRNHNQPVARNSIYLFARVFIVTNFSPLV